MSCWTTIERPTPYLFVIRCECGWEDEEGDYDNAVDAAQEHKAGY